MIIGKKKTLAHYRIMMVYSHIALLKEKFTKQTQLEDQTRHTRIAAEIFLSVLMRNVKYNLF